MQVKLHLESECEMKEYLTDDINELISHCDNLEDFKRDILIHLKGQRTTWIKKVNRIIEENGYTQTEFADLCGVTRVAVSKWCKGALPGNRDTFIRIGFAAHYGLDEMNEFLKRYGRYPELYAKSLEDSVCIFILNSQYLSHEYKQYEIIMRMFEEDIKVLKEKEYDDKGSFETSLYLDRLMKLENLRELKEFVIENASLYRTRYKKFYSYIQAYIELNNLNGRFDIKNLEKNKRKIHQLAEGQSWSSSLRQCVYAIYKRQWFPLRRKVIALGIHLNMDVDAINDMLELAHMETLYVKNPIEAAIIYALEDADLNGMIYCDGLDILSNHVREILIALQIPEAVMYIEDL